MSGRKPRIGFFVFKDIHIPHHLREYYPSVELKKAGWDVEWLLPKSGKETPDLRLDWPLVRYAECDFRGHKIIFPLYLAWFLRRRGIDVLWISGWARRDPDALQWLVGILRRFGVKVVYDTVDPIEMLDEAQGQSKETTERIRSQMKAVYASCDLILTVTPQIKAMTESLGVPADKVVCCRWGTDASVFRPDHASGDFRREIGVGEDVFLAGWLGSMNPFKGLQEIIVPLIKTFAERSARVHFVIAGYGILEAELRQWVADNPRMPVTILGRVPYAKAPDFTGSLNAYLVPTNPNTPFARAICPVKCFDALAMGVDLVTTRTEATGFLEPLSDLVHLGDFTVEFYERELERLVAAFSSGAHRSRKPFNAISHQAIARDISALIDGRFRKAVS